MGPSKPITLEPILLEIHEENNPDILHEILEGEIILGYEETQINKDEVREWIPEEIKSGLGIKTRKQTQMQED